MHWCVRVFNAILLLILSLLVNEELRIFSPWFLLLCVHYFPLFLFKIFFAQDSSVEDEGVKKNLCFIYLCECDPGFQV